jgi:hypothetical protein
MEDELLSDTRDTKAPDPAYSYQLMISELWVGHVYEIFRLLKIRDLVSQSDEFQSLAHLLELLRMTIDKHEIAKDKKLEAPVQMKRCPPRNDDSDFYEYSKRDLQRGHIMPTRTSHRGSVMWQVLDIVSDETFWIERRQLSERIIALFKSTTASGRHHKPGP